MNPRCQLVRDHTLSRGSAQYLGELSGYGEIILLFILIRNIGNVKRLPSLPLNNALAVPDARYRQIPLPAALIYIQAFSEPHIGCIVMDSLAVVLQPSAFISTGVFIGYSVQTRNARTHPHRRKAQGANGKDSGELELGHN